MKNYFEHEIKAKYIEGILSKNQEWQWLIDYIEAEFELSDISTWEEFENKNGYLNEVYKAFIRIIKVSNNSPVFKNPFLSELYKIAKYYLGEITKDEIKEKLKFNYSKILFLFVWITKLENQCNKPEWILDKRICKLQNFWQLINFDSIWLSSEELENYIEKSINIIDDNIKKCIYGNFHKKFYKYKENFIKKYGKNFLNVNAFNFQNITIKEIIPWQEQYLLDMIQINIKNKEIIPFMQLEGICTPDISLWTKKCIKQLKEYFNNNEIALFVLETISYVLYNEIPSKNIVVQHCKLFSDAIDGVINQNNISCSSFEIIIYLFKEKLFDKYKKETFYKNLIKQLNKINNSQLIIYFKENGIPLTSEQKTILKEYYNSLYKNVDNITSVNDLIDILKNKDIPKNINEEYFNKVCNLFNIYVNKEISFYTGGLFYYLMTFLLSVKKSNTVINKKTIENYAVNLLNLWQQEYYEKVIQSMHEYSYEKTISNETINDFSESIIKNPMIFVMTCMSVREKDIIHLMKIASENPLRSMITKININEVFPYIEKIENICEKHNMDDLLKNMLEKIIEKQSHKFLNILERNYYIFNLHESWVEKIKFNLAIFNQEKNLYNIIQEKYSNIKLIPYNEELSLAHVTQIFPILETKIRELSIEIGILPFKENDMLKYKDASSILRKILTDIYNESNQLYIGNDLFFIYNVMFNDNSLNIRNECLHGRNYMSGNALKTAFKLTLISLYLIIKRIENIKLVKNIN